MERVRNIVLAAVILLLHMPVGRIDVGRLEDMPILFPNQTYKL